MRNNNASDGLAASCVVWKFCGRVGDVCSGGGAKFGADEVGGKAGAKKTAVEGRDFALVERAAAPFQVARETLADERGFVGVGKDGVERGVDMLVGNATGAEFAGDAEASLAAGVRVLAGVVEGILRVVEIRLFAKTGDYLRD